MRRDAAKTRRHGGCVTGGRRGRCRLYFCRCEGRSHETGQLSTSVRAHGVTTVVGLTFETFLCSSRCSNIKLQLEILFLSCPHKHVQRVCVCVGLVLVTLSLYLLVSDRYLILQQSGPSTLKQLVVIPGAAFAKLNSFISHHQPGPFSCCPWSTSRAAGPQDPV